MPIGIWIYSNWIYSNCALTASAYELTAHKCTSYVLYTYFILCIYALVGGAFSIHDPYICAVHQSVPTNRTLSSTGPLSVQ